MIKCESLGINMYRITHTGKSVNFPVTGRISLGLAAFSISAHVIAYCPTEYWDLFLTFFNKKMRSLPNMYVSQKKLPLYIIRSKKKSSAIQFIDKVYIYFWNPIPK